MAENLAQPTTPERIAEVLRTQASQMDAGSKLPSVRLLMRRFGVSQMTVQRAISTLEEEGLVERQVGRGTFVVGGAGPMAKTITILRSDYPSRRGDEITRALHHALKSEGHRPIVLTYCDYARAIEMLRDAPHADAYVLQPMLPYVPLDLLSFLRKRSSAVVVDGGLDGANIDSLATDARAGLEIAAERLMELGHRRIALASGEPMIMWDQLAQHFRSLVRWAKLPNDPDPVIAADTQPNESSTAGMRERMERLIEEHRGVPFTAMAIGSYASAKGALQAFAAAGVRVPEDVSLIVLDNPDLGEDASVPLTMVGHTSEQIATRIVKEIERRWKDPDAPHGCVRHIPELVVRDSDRPIASS
ncbi:MAG: GntR family transcriptional regulator [Phycisphaeraceae bacterium]